MTREEHWALIEHYGRIISGKDNVGMNGHFPARAKKIVEMAERIQDLAKDVYGMEVEREQEMQKSCGQAQTQAPSAKR